MQCTKLALIKAKCWNDFCKTGADAKVSNRIHNTSTTAAQLCSLVPLREPIAFTNCKTAADAVVTVTSSE